MLGMKASSRTEIRMKSEFLGICRIYVPVLMTRNSELAGPRLTRIKQLNRGPYCVVHDTEFIVDEDRTEDKVHTDRTVRTIYLT
jgi:hypothetical protein